MRIRCARCRSPFALNVGRLFPQQHAQGYAAVVPESRPCRGERLGNLWVEVTGAPAGRTPLIALPAHPAFSHEILHDLLDHFGEYFQVCYVEFPGSQRNPAELQSVDYAGWLSDSLPAIKRRLGAPRVHLLAHLASAPTALRVAAEQPDEVASLVLLEPDLCLADRLRHARSPAHPDQTGREELTAALLRDLWQLPLEEPHLEGLTRILAAGLSPELLSRDLKECHRLSYGTLCRLAVPVLVFSARDQKDPGDSLFLQASLPAVESAALEKGGAVAPWLGGTWFGGKLQAFKRAADLVEPGAAGRADAAQTARQSPTGAVRRRIQTMNGQPAGWLLFLYALLATALTAAGTRLRFEPSYLQFVLPQVLAGLLPVLWLLVPRRINPFSFLRFRGLSLGSAAVPLLAGTALGLAFRVLLAAAPGAVSAELPAAGSAASGAVVPRTLQGLRALGLASAASLPPGQPGRLAVFAAAAVAALLVYGAGANLLLLRRSRAAVWVPALIFCLFPASWPDLLWRLPTAVLAAVMFARSLSILGPLFLLGGIALGSELRLLQTWLPRVLRWWPVPAEGAGLGTAGLLLAAAVVLTAVWGGRGRPVSASKRYFASTLNQPGRLLRWDPGPGVVLGVFSALAAAGVVFLFLAA